MRPDLCVLGEKLTLSLITGTPFSCGLTYILWISQIVEVKYRPKQLVQKEHNESRKTVSLMLRMCRPIFGSGKAVDLDIEFCVSKGI